MVPSKHNLRSRALLPGALLALIAAPALGQGGALGQTAVSFNFPNIVILNYPANLTLNFNADDPLEDAVDEGALTPAAVNFAGAAAKTLDASINPTAGTLMLPTTFNVTVNNVWAVRGLSTSGDITVEGTINTAAATNGGSSVTMSNLQVSDGTSTGTSINVPAPGFVLANRVLGGIQFDLDVNNLTSAAAHTGAQYTITASAP